MFEQNKASYLNSSSKFEISSFVIMGSLIMVLIIGLLI